MSDTDGFVLSGIYVLSIDQQHIINTVNIVIEDTKVRHLKLKHYKMFVI